MERDDLFVEPSPKQSLLRRVLLAEADAKAARFGVSRRGFLGGSMGAVAALSIADQAHAWRSDAEGRDEFRAPADDTYARVCEQAEFTTLDASTPADWDLIAAAGQAQHRAVADTVLNMLRNLKGVHAGFLVDQDTHVTQTATRAFRANAADEMVLLSLIHDAAKIISNANHPELIAAIARPYISDGAYRVLRHHMEFQWKHYGNFIAKPTDLRDRYASEPWFADAATFSDAYDQTSFDPDYDTLPLEEFESLVYGFFGKQPDPRNRTAEDCL